MVDMRHMEYLEAVAASDVAVLRRKEATYAGSWKRAGGVSAWMMGRRNMDRLLKMMSAPETPHGFSLADLDDVIAQSRESALKDGAGDCTVDYSILEYLRDAYVAQDVFARIELDPSGQDGSVLACLRDLRRYMMLIEAEMVARGEVRPEGQPPKSDQPKVDLGTLSDRQLSNVLHGRDQDDNGEFTASSMGTAKEAAAYYTAKTFAPPVVLPVGELVRVLGQVVITRKMSDMLYRSCGTDNAQLEIAINLVQAKDLLAAIDSPGCPPEAKALLSAVHGCYRRIMTSDWYVLDPKFIPEDFRENYLRLPRELNAKEHEGHQVWVRAMYWWDNVSKFLLHDDWAGYAKD